MAVAVVAQYVIDNLRYLLLQLADELGGVVFLVLYVAEFLLPDAGEFAAFEQFFVYGVYEFYTRRGGYEVLSLTLYVMTLEESLDDSSS